MSPNVVIGLNASKAVVAVVAPVPPLPIAKVPVTPVLNGKPVADVKVTALGVPKLGVVNTGDVVRAILPVPDTF